MTSAAACVLGPPSTDGVRPAAPFRRQSALEAGITAKQLRGPAFRLVLPGTYVAAATVVTPETRARAALLPYGEVAWASHASAARVYGLPIPTIALEHVSVPRAGQRRRHAGIKVHVGGRATTRVVNGVRLSEPRMLFVEMASLLGLVDLVVLGDAMARRRMVTPAALVDWCADVADPAARAARQAAAYVRAKVDSPMESRLRMLIVLAGLPEPVVNLEVRDEVGEVIRNMTCRTRRSGSRSSTTARSTSSPPRRGSPTSNAGVPSTMRGGGCSR